MNIEAVIEHFGGAAELARQLGCTSQYVYKMRRTGIPLPRQYQIEVLSDGNFRAQRPESSAAA